MFDIDLNFDIDERYKYLRNYHHKTKDQKIIEINSFSELIDSIKKERELFESFLKEDYDNYRWYQKASWHIKKMDTNFIKSMYDFINMKSEYYDFIINDGPFKTDGFIISPLNGDNEIKVKPKDLMTIDLKYYDGEYMDREGNKYEIITGDDINVINNHIYRCYPIYNSFYAKDIRYDKNMANPYNIVNNIMNLSKINYDITESKYYHNVTFRNNKNWNNIVKNNLNNLLNVNKFMHTKESVLDLGCGKSKIIKSNIEFSDYMGYDYDNYILLNNMKMKKRNTKFNYVDLSGDWNDTKNKWYDILYKKYKNIYAVNSLMHFNTEKFWEQLNIVSEKGTRFLFNLLSSNKNKEIYWIDNDSYMKQNNNTIEIYFENVHSKPLIEKYITINDINDYLKKYNFEIIYKFTSSNDDITDLYDWYVCEKIS